MLLVMVYIIMVQWCVIGDGYIIIVLLCVIGDGLYHHGRGLCYW